MPASSLARPSGSSPPVMSYPSPNPMCRRSRTVVGRAAGTVSVNSPWRCLSTLRSAHSGTQRSTGSSSTSTPSSTRPRAHVVPRSFVTDEIWKMASTSAPSASMVTTRSSSGLSAIAQATPGATIFGTSSRITAATRAALAVRVSMDLRYVSTVPPGRVPYFLYECARLIEDAHAARRFIGAQLKEAFSA